MVTTSSFLQVNIIGSFEIFKQFLPAPAKVTDGFCLNLMSIYMCIIEKLLHFKGPNVTNPNVTATLKTKYDFYSITHSMFHIFHHAK